MASTLNFSKKIENPLGVPLFLLKNYLNNMNKNKYGITNIENKKYISRNCVRKSEKDDKNEK